MKILECAFRKAPHPLNCGVSGCCPEFRLVTAQRSLSFIPSHPKATHPQKMMKKRISPYYQAEKDEFQSNCFQAWEEKYRPLVLSLGFKNMPWPIKGSRIKVYSYAWATTDGLMFNLNYGTVGLRREMCMFDGKRWHVIDRRLKVAPIHAQPSLQNQ